LVFFGHDGFDELTTTTTSTIFELKAGSITNYKIDPTELGLANTTLESLAGGDANTNAAIVDKTLAGEIGPVRDIAVLNAAAALVAADHATDFSEGISQAIAAIDSGAARAILESWVAVSSEARASEA
jgi:anthranilate phosphoribosyltransferase